MPNILQDCESIKRQLKAARKTLNILEEQAAAIPVIERDVSLSIKLKKQQQLVAELQKKLDECIERG